MRVVKDRQLLLLFPSVTDLVDVFLESPQDLRNLSQLAKVLLTLHKLERSRLLEDDLTSIINSNLA